MNRFPILLSCLITICFAYKANGQVIRGQTIDKFIDDYEPLPGVTILVDSMYVMSDIDGLFIVDSLSSFPDSIMFSGPVDLKIINLPDNYDTLDLAKIELIRSKIISPNQYDSIRSELIKTYDLDIIIVQQNKADKFLQDKYEPIRDWNHILGYLVKGEYEKTSISHPYDSQREIELNYNDLYNLFILDYNTLKD